MARILSTISLLFLCFVISTCEKQRDADFGPSQGNTDFGQYPGNPDVMMEPNFFKKIGSHIVKGWHGFRSLFGRKSNRREENIYGNGYGYGREDKQKPYEKETYVNKEYPESNYNNNNNNYGEYNQNQLQGQNNKGNKEGNQVYPVNVEENLKGDANKGQKENKVYEFEESSNIKPLDQRKGERKDKDDDKKSSQPVNNINNGNAYETRIVDQNLADGKQRSRRDLRGRFPYGRPFRPPFRPPFRSPFRRPFGRPFGRRPFGGNY